MESIIIRSSFIVNTSSFLDLSISDFIGQFFHCDGDLGVAKLRKRNVLHNLVLEVFAPHWETAPNP